MLTNAHIEEAAYIGRQAAEAAAIWIVDGNTPQEAIRRTLALIEEGDDIEPYCPPWPDLSGEWADDPTPLSLARDILGDDDPDPDDIDALADAFEAVVSETFTDACERNLRAALAHCEACAEVLDTPDPDFCADCLSSMRAARGL